MTPFDQPNVVIAPFVPGFFVDAIIQGFKERPMPIGMEAVFVAAVNSTFYAAAVIASYWVYKNILSRRVCK